MAALIVFDDGLGRLAPLTDLRAAFEIRTGAFTTLERIERAAARPAAAVFAPSEVAALTRTAIEARVNEMPLEESALVVNGRCVLPPEGFERIPGGSAFVEQESGHVIAARLPRASAERFLKEWALPAGVTTTPMANRCLLHHPEDVIRFRDRALERDLASFGGRDEKERTPLLGVIEIEGHPVHVNEDAEVFPTVVLDASKGSIVIARGAVVRPGAIVCGPAFIGEGTTIIDRAHIKGNTAIGPRCKIGGEVGGTIVQGHSNKSHDGHLGDSWVGEWVNFGAGTMNSNLLNTYGEVTMRFAADEARRWTGLTFLGCVVGDHVKFAIGTRIMTGSIFGTGAMIATTAPPPVSVDRFAWLTDSGAQRYRLDKFLEVARAVMGRRHVEPGQALLRRLRELHAGAPVSGRR